MNEIGMYHVIQGGMNRNRPYKFPMPKFTPQAIPPYSLLCNTPNPKIPPRVASKTPKYGPNM